MPSRLNATERGVRSCSALFAYGMYNYNWNVIEIYYPASLNFDNGYARLIRVEDSIWYKWSKPSENSERPDKQTGMCLCSSHSLKAGLLQTWSNKKKDYMRSGVFSSCV